MPPLTRDALIEQFAAYAPHVDTAILGKAWDFSIKAHGDQARASGEVYFVHCQSVASSLVEWKMDLPTICAGLLHDTLEDTPVTEAIMRAEFGDEITRLVVGVTKLEHLEYSSRDEVQAENCALALLVLKTLGVYRQTVTEEALQTAKLPGRMELISTAPPIIIDGAHTVESLRHLLNSFTQLYGTTGNTVIYGVLEDKDHIHMTRLLLPLFERIIVARPGTFKKSNPEALFLLLQEEIKEMRNPPRLFLEKDPDKALELAMETTEDPHAILCTGSFYLVGDIVAAYRKVEEMASKELEVVACP